jgi:beta-mannosidase
MAKATSSNRPEPPAWFREDFDDSDWERVTVPEWRYAAEAPKQPVSCILWYRTRFAAKPVKPGQRAFVVFAGVDWEAEVWLNGRFIGRHKVYCEPFRLDVTDTLKGENVLAVRVIAGPRFGEPIAYWAVLPDPPAREQRFVRDPGKSIAGYQKCSPHLGGGFGIHREVFLETTGEASIAEVFARGDPASGTAKITLETDSIAARQLDLKVLILPENFSGRSYRQAMSSRIPQGAGTQSLSIPMPGAQLWSPQTPCLYRCRVILRNGDRVVDARDVLFGCRSFGLVSRRNPHPGLPEGMFLLNGQPIFLRGANVSPALNLFWYWNQPDKLTEAVLMLKAANYNALRVCQHVSFPEVRELLDRLGVLSEQDQGGGRNGNTPEALAELAQAGTALARVCYNNPGVVLLSFANESHFDPTRIVQAALAVDPERILVPISGNDNAQDPPPGYPMPEALWNNVMDDFHMYYGWYRDSAKVWKLSRLRDPGRLVTMGEYGAEALDGYETMARHYPPSFGTTPPVSEDALWGEVQVQKADERQRIGFRGQRPGNLGEYIAASQNYQADVLAEVTKGHRLSPRRIAGYFQFHFIDATAALWPKSIVSHDL